MSFYGLSKVTVEHYLRLYQQSFGLDFVILRFANVYGERQGNGGEGGVISIFAQRLAEGKALAIYGDGEQTRDFIYAGDIAAGIYAALCTENVNRATTSRRRRRRASRSSSPFSAMLPTRQSNRVT